VAQVTWADAAVAGIEEIRRFIAAENPTAAERIARLLVAAAERLSELPHRGVPVEGGGRKLIAAPYVIFYRVSDNGRTVTITAVLDGRRIA
jgi:toxin ParE1/3/4